MSCQYCRMTNIKSYINYKRKIPTNYCPVCGEKRKLNLSICGINYPITYCNQNDIKNNILSEININIPETFPIICDRLNIPEEYQNKIKELLIEELYKVIDLLDTKDEFTMLVPESDKWSKYADSIIRYKQEHK